MRFGNWRGVTLALALGSALATIPTTTSANPFHHDIPRLVPAVDVNTGGPYYAPPIPYGHYAGKDHAGKIHGAFGMLTGGLLGKLHGLGGCGNGCGGNAPDRLASVPRLPQDAGMVRAQESTSPAAARSIPDTPGGNHRTM